MSNTLEYEVRTTQRFDVEKEWRRTKTLDLRMCHRKQQRTVAV